MTPKERMTEQIERLAKLSGKVKPPCQKQKRLQSRAAVEARFESVLAISQAGTLNDYQQGYVAALDWVLKKEENHVGTQRPDSGE
jgi:hypothetical protein